MSHILAPLSVCNLTNAVRGLYEITPMHIEISWNYVIDPDKFSFGLRQGWELIYPLLRNTQNTTFIYGA